MDYNERKNRIRETLQKAVSAMFNEDKHAIEPLSEFVRHYKRVNDEVSSVYGAHALTLILFILAHASAKRMYNQCMQADEIIPGPDIPEYHEWVAKTKQNARVIRDIIDTNEVVHLIRQAYGPRDSAADRLLHNVLTECLAVNGIIVMDESSDEDHKLPGVK